MADIFNMADTWNAGGTTFTAIKMDVTDTASAAASLLMDLLVGGASKFRVDKAGNALAGAGLSTAPSWSFIGDPDTGLYNATPNVIEVVTGAARVASIYSSGLYLRSAAVFGWASSSNPSGASDLYLYRDNAGILAQRNLTNAQAFRWYHTYTDGSNYQRGSLRTAAGYVELAAETAGTGADDLDVLLTPAGTGAVRFGTHAALSGESVTGYITIKDAGGTTRKIAVVS